VCVDLGVAAESPGPRAGGRPSSRRSTGLVAQCQRPRPELLAPHELCSSRSPKPSNNVGPWPATTGCTTNSYSSINPRSANASGRVTPPTNRPPPGSRLSCCAACCKSPPRAPRSNRPDPKCSSRRTSSPRRSFGRRRSLNHPSSQATYPTPVAATLPPSSRRSPDRRAAHPHVPGWRPSSYATPHLRGSPGDRNSRQGSH
jgi:hypothetical protein